MKNAIRVQREAIALLPENDEDDPQGRARLRLYEAGKPYQEDAEDPNTPAGD